MLHSRFLYRYNLADSLQSFGNTNIINYTTLFPLCCIQHNGNTKDKGQVILSTIGNIRQPKSEKYEPVENLPFITDEFGELLKTSEKEDNTPSCSLAEALQKQDLFINASLVQMGCSLIWNLFRYGLTPYRGFFHNLKDFNTQPIKIA